MKLIIASIFSLLLLTSQSSLALPGDGGPGVLVFGVYAHIRSTEMLKKVAPLQRYLQRVMVEQGRAEEITLKIFPAYSDAIEALVKGEVDFVRFGPVSYVLATEQNPELRLLAMESNAGGKSFDGVISVRADSPIHSIAGLRGKRIAFGNRCSTTGRYLAQAALVRAGLTADDLADYAYLGRHDKVAFAVASGSYDAGATNENTFYKYAKEKGLREIARFPCITKPWVARAGLDEDVFRALQTALLELKDTDVLRAIKRTGFLRAEDADYDQVRRAMELAKQFDTESLTFAVYTSEKPSEVYTQVRPALDHLQRQLAAEGRVNKIRIRVFRNYEGAIDALVRGEVQLGRYGPASYLLAKSKNPAIRPLAREDDARRQGPHGVVVVSNRSPITRLEQLAGKTFAFGSPYSTEGRFMAQVELRKAGVAGPDLKSFNFLGRHDRVAYAVAAGNYDAGALRETVLERYEVGSRLRVIGRFSVPHKLWVAWEGIKGGLFQALQRALLDMREHEALHLLPAAGFAPVADQEYEVVRESIRSAESFDSRR